MNIVVTGIAPRCGTSAMMRILLDNGWQSHSHAEQFPSYTVKAKNPKGFWDVSQEFVENPTPIAMGDNECIKLWYPHFNLVDWSTVDLMVVMHRTDFVQQLSSIKKCAGAEGLTLTAKQYAEMFTNSNKYINNVQDSVKQLKVPMRYLRGSPKSVLHNIKEIV